MRVLFLNDCNSHYIQNPIADLIDVFDTSELIMKNLERNQRGAGRLGGRWKLIMTDGNIKYNHISNGHKNDYSESDYDLVYKLISGNY